MIFTNKASRVQSQVIVEHQEQNSERCEGSSVTEREINLGPPGDYSTGESLKNMLPRGQKLQ